MAHSYTPGLTVTERTIVRRRRILPLPGKVMVNTGDPVRSEQAVARAELPGKVYPVNLANQLSIAPDEIKDYLVKKEGDAVQKDEVREGGFAVVVSGLSKGCGSSREHAPQAIRRRGFGVVGGGSGSAGMQPVRLRISTTIMMFPDIGRMISAKMRQKLPESMIAAFTSSRGMSL